MGGGGTCLRPLTREHSLSPPSLCSVLTLRAWAAPADAAAGPPPAAPLLLVSPLPGNALADPADPSAASLWPRALPPPAPSAPPSLSRGAAAAPSSSATRAVRAPPPWAFSPPGRTAHDLPSVGTPIQTVGVDLRGGGGGGVRGAGAPAGWAVSLTHAGAPAAAASPASPPPAPPLDFVLTWDCAADASSACPSPGPDAPACGGPGRGTCVPRPRGCARPDGAATAGACAACACEPGWAGGACERGVRVLDVDAAASVSTATTAAAPAGRWEHFEWRAPPAGGSGGAGGDKNATRAAAAAAPAATTTGALLVELDRRAGDVALMVQRIAGDDGPASRGALPTEGVRLGGGGGVGAGPSPSPSSAASMLRQWLQRTGGDEAAASIFGDGGDEEEEEGGGGGPPTLPPAVGATPLAPPGADAAGWAAGDAAPSVLVSAVRPGDVFAVSVLTADVRSKEAGAYRVTARWGGWKQNERNATAAAALAPLSSTAAAAAPVCPQACGAATGYGACIADGACVCAPGRGGAACQGPAALLAPGQAAVGDVPPGGWAFFTLLPRAGPAQDADRRLLVLAYDTQGGHPLVLARRAAGGGGGEAASEGGWPAPGSADAVLRAGAFASGPDAVAFDPADGGDPTAPMRIAIYNAPLAGAGAGGGAGGASLSFRLRLGVGPPADPALRAGAGAKRGAIAAWLAAALALSGLVTVCGVGLAIRGVAVVVAARRAARASGAGGVGGGGRWFAPAAPPAAPPGLSPAAIAALPTRVYAGRASSADGGGGAKPPPAAAAGLSLTAAVVSAGEAAPPAPPPKAGPGDAAAPPPPPPRVLHHALSADWRPQCAVCVCEFEAGEALTALPGCGHEYHAACIAGWLARAATCPVCRAGVDGERGRGGGGGGGGGERVGGGVGEGGGVAAAALEGGGVVQV